MERLVEGACVSKHLLFEVNFGHVPLIERLVERACAIKQFVHIRHIGHVPIIERLVEGGCEPKHLVHSRNTGHVPIANLAVFCHNTLLPVRVHALSGGRRRRVTQE